MTSMTNGKCNLTQESGPFITLHKFVNIGVPSFRSGIAVWFFSRLVFLRHNGAADEPTGGTLPLETAMRTNPTGINRGHHNGPVFDKTYDGLQHIRLIYLMQTEVEGVPALQLM
jgi:hypothetical protein